MSTYRGLRTALFLVLCIAPWDVQCNNYIMHSKTMLGTCDVPVQAIMSSDLQLEICRRWTHKKPILHWNMSDWEVISDPTDSRLTQHKLRILPGQAVQYTTISYETSVKLPSILEKITNINLSISISKKLFIYNQKVYSFVQIDKVPVVGFLTISNVADIIGKRKISSRHMISHGDIPWYASWAVDILKNEILKSVDTYDRTCLEVYCE